MTSIQQLKKSLRRSIARKLKELSQEETARQSQAVLARIRSSRIIDDIKGGGVSCYLSMQKGELGTDGIVEEILERGIPLYVPIIPPPQPQSSNPGGLTTFSTDMRFLRLYSMTDFKACKRDKWGIPDAGGFRLDVEGEVAREDAMDKEAVPLSLILVPGVAFDKGLRRLGHGKGYYDRYIQLYSAFAQQNGQAPPRLAALSLSDQILQDGDEVPVTDHDYLMDEIFTPDTKLC